MTTALPAEELDNRRTRRIAFVVITLVFIVSVAAMIYWAVNVAGARICSRLTANLRAIDPLASHANGKAMQPFTVFQLERSITA